MTPVQFLCCRFMLHSQCCSIDFRFCFFFFFFCRHIYMLCNFAAACCCAVSDWNVALGLGKKNIWPDKNNRGNAALTHPLHSPEASPADKHTWNTELCVIYVVVSKTSVLRFMLCGVIVIFFLPVQFF